MVIVETYLNVVDNRKLLEKTDILEGSCDTRTVCLNGAHICDVCAVKDNGAGVCLVNACQHIEHGSLSCAVGADKTVKLTFFDSKIKFAYGFKTAEGNAQI